MHPQILFLPKQHPHPNPPPRKRRRGSRVPQFQRFQTTCALQSLSKLLPPPWGRVGERAKQLPLKPTFPQPQQTLSRRRGNRVPQPQHFQTACIPQIRSNPLPPPWGRAGERAKQLPLKPTFPQPQQPLSLTLSRRRRNRVPQLQHFQTTCVLQTLSKLPPPPWGRVGERAKQLSHKPTFPQPQQTLSLTLSRRRGNKVPQLHHFQTIPKLKGYPKTPYATLTVNLSCWVTV